MGNFCYLRVSSDSQDVLNQKESVLKFVNSKGWQVQFIEDITSSKVHWKNRKIGDIINIATEGDRVIFAEISRAGRSTLEVLEMFEILATKKVEIYTVKEGINFEFDTDIKKSMNMMIVACLASVAQIERAFIGARAKEAIKRLTDAAAARGEKYINPKTGHGIGRPRGSASNVKLDARKNEIEDFLKRGINTANVAKFLGCSRNTLYRWAKRRGFDLSKESKPINTPLVAINKTAPVVVRKVPAKR